jgi:hypothetical protein
MHNALYELVTESSSYRQLEGAIRRPKLASWPSAGLVCVRYDHITGLEQLLSLWLSTGTLRLSTTPPRPSAIHS